MRLNKPFFAAVIVICTAMVCEAADENVPHAKGHLTLKFTERDPLSMPDELARRIRLSQGGEAATQPSDAADAGYDLANEPFDVFVPENYKPTVAHGLLVWMGVSEFSPKWFDVLPRHKLIYVAAPQVQNGKFARLGLPIDAVANMKKLYNVDEKRVYISGFSAGAGRSVFMLTGYPEVFRGGLFFHSGPFYMCQKEATVLPMAPAWNGPLDQIKRETPLVLMWGGRDKQYTPAECRAQYDGLVLDGFQRAAMFIVPDLDHRPPNAAWFEKGIAALDQTKPQKPPTTAPTTRPNPELGQIAQAKRLIATARLVLYQRDQSIKKYPGAAARFEKNAREYLQQVLDDYPTTPSAAIAKKLLEELDHPAAGAPVGR